MRVIPQLGTLSSIQLPASSGQQTRTPRNRLSGGTSVSYADPRSRRSIWRLEYRAATGAERQSLEAFFQDVEGRLQPFTFLDPFQNLFSRSADLTHGVWFTQAPLALTGGAGDPEGGSAAFGMANPSPAPLRIYQQLDIPAWYHYSLSVYARSVSSASLVLSLEAGSNIVSRSFPLSTVWKRYTFPASPGGTAESVRAGFEIAAAGELLLFGPQLEAQPAPSDYKATTAEGGIYSNARLLQDELVWTASAPGLHDTRLTIAST